MTRKLTEKDISDAAKELDVEVAALKAVLEIEAPKGGFMTDGQVTILFERHYFSRLTGGKYDLSHPDISSKKAGGYGKQSEQHPKLQRAVALDRDAALRSASWGKPQIMGANFRLCGCSTIQSFINEMHKGEREQLMLMVRFIQNSPKLHKAIQAKHWPEVARLYNGPNYAINDYDNKLARSYKRFRESAV